MCIARVKLIVQSSGDYFQQKPASVLAGIIKLFYFCIRDSKRAISSVGLEHLPYKQGVVGSNPTSPTEKAGPVHLCGAFCFPNGSTTTAYYQSTFLWVNNTQPVDLTIL